MKKYRKKIAFITIFTFVSFLISSSYPARNDQESVGLNLIKEGETLYSSFKYKESIEKFKLAKKYIKSDKNRYRLYLNLSKSYYALGLKKETEKALKEMFKLKLDQEINEGEFPRGYLEIYHRIEKKYVTPLVSEEEITPKKVTVVEKPGKKKKKKKSPVLIIVVISAVAVLAVLLGK